MDDIWESFPCQIGEHPAFIGFNLSFAQRAEEGLAAPNFASFRVSLQAPNEAGLPEGAEFARLNRLEDRLCAAIVQAGGQQVGRTTGGGHRDFAFYTTLDEDACWALVDALAADSGYSLLLFHQADPQCEHYWQTLYPTLEDWQIIRDIQCEQALRAQGDDLSEPREVLHWVQFAAEEARSQFLATLPAGLSVQALYESSEQAPSQFVSCLSHHGLADHRSISHFSIPLACAAHAAGGSYQGWQAELRAATPA